MTANKKERAQIGLCESQPATAEGVRLHLARSEDLDCRWVVSHPGIGLQLARQQPVDLFFLDKSCGQPAVSEAIADLRTFAPQVPVLIWGSSITEQEALRLIQAGAAGLLRKTAPIPVVLDCIRALLAGGSWYADFLRPQNAPCEGRLELTAREKQVLALVERGLRNKSIAAELGIRPGTVKIHLRHIFEKKGVHGRCGLALSGLNERAGVDRPASQTQVLS
jgi:DNA-binding NarL/FixJ family response regulator